MSSNFPPGDGPGSQSTPPPPPPGGQPVPDYLDSGHDAGGTGEPPKRGRGRRIAAIGGGIGVVALVGGGVWAWNFWFNQGPQPSEALPADTLAYVSIDMAPTGEQTAEFVQMAKKFPFFEEEFGFDLDSKGDVKKWIFEKIQDEGDVCGDLDYDDDLEPWLGDRFAFAVVDREAENPAPVLVVQVTDEDQAVDGLEALLECGQGEDGLGENELSGYAFNGDWVILAETERLAKDVVEAAKDEPLADDEDFQSLVDAAGDPGVLTAYVAPDAGAAILDSEFGEEFVDGFLLGFQRGSDGAFDPSVGEEFADNFRESIESFPGLAGTLRFDDGDVELEVATGELDDATQDLLFLMPGDEAGDVAAGLPDSTVATLAYSFEDGWLDAILEQLRPVIEDASGMSMEDALAEFEAESGLTIPEDIETLVGDGIAVAVDSSISMDVFEHEDPSLLPAGIRIKGEPEEIEAVLDKLRERLGQDARFLVSESDGDYVLIGTNEEYVAKLAEEDGLGQDETFREVVEADEASTLFYVNFDAEDWLVDMLEEADEDEAAENLQHLSAFGLSAWMEDGESHFLVKLTTD